MQAGTVATRSPAPWALAALSLGCAAIHAVVTPPHFEEYALFGWFFLIVTVFQVVWAATIVLYPTRPWLVVGAAVNLGIALIWLWSRTAGLPIGPEPGVPEAIGVRDVVSTIYEVVLAAVAIYAIVARPPVERRVGQLAAAFVLIVAVVTAVAIASPEPEEHDMGLPALRAVTVR